MVKSGDQLPIYASRVLKDADSRYSQIEKETLALTFGCEKFHPFVYGIKFTAETDHKPFIQIASKALGEMPPRLQRFFLRLLRYDFNLQFVPGKELILADTLSRAPKTTSNEDASDDVEIHATNILFDRVSLTTVKRLQEATAQDPVLQKVVTAITNNKTIDGVFRHMTPELSVLKGIVFKGERVVVPRLMRSEMLKRINDGHQGISKCKAKARRLVFLARPKCGHRVYGR